MEKTNKADRLREASRRLEELPLEHSPSAAEWDAATEELTTDESAYLKTLASRHLERALDPEAQPSDAVEEARSAVLLWPRDEGWAKEVLGSVRAAKWPGKEAEVFLALLGRRLARGPLGALPRWVVPFFVALIAVPATIAFASMIWSSLARNTAVSPVQGPRDLQSVFDTQGVKTNIQVAQSRLLIFPEATVAEISAWVTFPDHRVGLWEGTVSVLDAQGQPLTTREVTFRASSEGPLEAGQGIAIFQQFDAWPFYDKVSSFQISTSRILAQEAHPRDRKELAVQGVDALTAGYNLKVWLQDAQWSDRFASKANTLSLEIENAGLKPFAELAFTLRWRTPDGKTLKTLSLRPVSPFKTALPSGARLPWIQETIFDTEVFSWLKGEEPYPVLELTHWQ